MKILNLLLIVSTGLSAAGHTKSASAKIVMFGDFGTGNADQRVVADDMTKYCATHTCDYGVTTGDNVYPRGVESLKNGKADYDNGAPNYQVLVDRFVKMYGDTKIPFYMTFGNHDVGNEGVLSIFKNLFTSSATIKKRTIGLIKNQISFSNHKDNPAVVDALGRQSRVWFFPDEYYYVQEKGPGTGKVSLYPINTNSYPHRALTTNNDAIHPNEQNNLQKTWLTTKLSDHPQDWKIVFGHMPLISRGRHGHKDARAIAEFTASIMITLCEAKVDFYVAGHDHHLEVDRFPCPNGHVIAHVLTGGAAKRDGIYQSAFPSPLSRERSFLWGNGKPFTDDKSIYSKDDFALGFAYLEILNDTDAHLRMKISLAASPTQQDGCFAIKRGKSVAVVPCE